jgi:hypothetical protein
MKLAKFAESAEGCNLLKEADSSASASLGVGMTRIKYC